MTGRKEGAYDSILGNAALAWISTEDDSPNAFFEKANRLSHSWRWFVMPIGALMVALRVVTLGRRHLGSLSLAALFRGKMRSRVRFFADRRDCGVFGA